ncbi:MAG: hypothetical protein ACKVX7_15640 [Planctomycetota bacterium]
MSRILNIDAPTFLRSPRLLIRLAAVLSVIAAICADLPAVHAGGCVFRLTSDLSGGTTALSTVKLDNSCGEIEGWSFGVCFGDAPINIQSVEPTPLVATVAGGGPPALQSIEIHAEGFTVTTVISLAGPVTGMTLPPGIDYPLYVATFSSAVDALAEISICGELGTPPVPILVTTESGDEAAAVGAAQHLAFTHFPAMNAPFQRGDCNSDAAMQVSDAVFLLEWLFQSGANPECRVACDVNDDNGANISDVVFLLNYLFASGPTPPAPFPACGVDPTPGSLQCETPRCLSAPTSLSYSSPAAQYFVGTAIPPNIPTVAGAPAEIFLVTPPLPAGISLTPDSGVIIGVPLTAATTNHTVLAANLAGGVTTTISVVVIDSTVPALGSNQFYLGPTLNVRRYGHTATALADGRVLVVGGTDERFFTSLDTLEIFDQAVATSPPPPSLAGAFIDTDFLGNPLTLDTGGRVGHTATLLADGSVLIAGGTNDFLVADACSDSLVFDAITRTFASDLQPLNTMIFPRFRHTANRLPDGRVLLAGGQRAVIETIIDPNFPPGSPFFQFDITVFPSTRTVECFDPATRSFELAIDLLGQPTEMQSTRGRFGHSVVAMAGLDGEIDTIDDVLLFAGGTQTLSAIFAPQLKFPGQPESVALPGVEYYDLASGVLALAPGGVVIPRVRAALLNLGSHAPSTWDGVAGVNNVALVTGGDSDVGICLAAVPSSQIVSCTFTGFGPASGIQFFVFSPISAQAGRESSIATSLQCAHGRAFADFVVLPNRRVYSGAVFDGNWVFTAGGVHTALTPGGCIEIAEGLCLSELRGASFFDPFFNATLAAPWDLAATSSPQNPTGVVGSWLNGDAEIPDASLIGYGDGSAPALLNVPRVYHTMTVIPGEDNVLGTIDDRVVVIGGGDTALGIIGGAPVQASCEIYVPPAGP